ncbi:TPA: dihydrofolate reductase [Streptococcus equi subsp. zooepidemicus]|uniref:dihydrofolate reductase n=1 Tax=Streptococcus equi subsp. zooepidemicus TaxID=40041 RepID=A0AAX2LHF2_STRSZ|nr:dihydrofolate reductase [Streptococcus equi]MCD3410006.1 dihydrofolate reductase [Streptococcus equi subsp. zooepidemicus]MCD3446259.1 dihydrofolate reductase [Streptococcus equi subsp. zooepidemicus]MDI5990103.1 dihydrofolate reductase [Streptococcus equi subsp. zooepidemicus]SQE96032.1 dihydrofolate reductase [Streptococcus equi subsp. zooepidemicus]SUO82210.1 dihydrofolate reductase [Streptococcus equi subsp. zooepidemicus]
MTKKIIAIWAEDEAGLIGACGRLPWYLPKELQHFKETTLNQAILMGRVTFEGMKGRLLPNRQTLVMTRDSYYHVEGALTITSVQEALDWYHAQDKTLYVIGGSKVLEAFDGYFDVIIKTVVHHRFEGDTYSPRLELSDFVEETSVLYPRDDNNPYDFTVTVLRHR